MTPRSASQRVAPDIERMGRFMSCQVSASEGPKQATVSERREFEISRGAERGCVVSIAPGLGQPRPKRQGEARGLHVYEIDDHNLRIQTFVWRETDWSLTAERRFPVGRGPLESEPG